MTHAAHTGSILQNTSLSPTLTVNLLIGQYTDWASDGSPGLLNSHLLSFAELLVRVHVAWASLSSHIGCSAQCGPVCDGCSHWPGHWPPL